VLEKHPHERNGPQISTMRSVRKPSVPPSQLSTPPARTPPPLRHLPAPNRQSPVVPTLTPPPPSRRTSTMDPSHSPPASSTSGDLQTLPEPSFQTKSVAGPGCDVDSRVVSAVTHTPVWQVINHPDNGIPYYWNTRTNTVSWKTPSDYDGKEVLRVWHVIEQPGSGKPYYFNRNTQAVVWDKPTTFDGESESDTNSHMRTPARIDGPDSKVNHFREEQDSVRDTMIDKLVSNMANEIESADSKCMDHVPIPASDLAALVEQVNKAREDASKAANKADSASSEFARIMQNKLATLESVLAKHEADLQVEQQRSYITSVDNLNEFYTVFQLCVNSSFASAQSLFGGYTKLNDDAATDRGMSTATKVAAYMSRAINTIAKYTPLAGPLVQLVGDAAGAVANHNAHNAVGYIAQSCTSSSTLSECMEKVARYLCLHQHDHLVEFSTCAAARGSKSVKDHLISSGDKFVSDCSDVAKALVTVLLRDLMRSTGDAKKVLPHVLDTSNACVTKVCSLLLELEVKDLSLSQDTVSSFTSVDVIHSCCCCK
jgi:WW domain